MIDKNKYENGLSDRQSSPSRVRDGLTFLLVGSGIGALLALLFAPKSGSELRGEIADATRKGYDATVEKAGELKAQSSDALKIAKEKAEAALDLVSTKLKVGSELIDDIASDAKKAVSDPKESVEKGIANVQQDVDQAAKRAGAGHKASSIV